MKLIITGPLQQKIDYLLNRFDIEWSGPAWFTYETTDKGFPNKWKLEYFLPLDLGSHSETEWTGKHFLQRSKKLYKVHPELLKMYQGNIHSHHTMGAFFSSTDKQALTDNANEVGYPSLVVANGGKEEHAFAISYLDQWRQPHMFAASDIEIDIDIEEDDEWVKEADTIQKRYDRHRKKKGYTTNYGTTSYGNQVSIWNPGDYHERIYGLPIEITNKLDWEQKTKAKRIVEAGGQPLASVDDKGNYDITVKPIEECIDNVGVTDDQVKKELDKAKDPKERYEIAIDALEMGFMDDADFQKEVDRLGSHFKPDEVDAIHAKYMEERDNADEIADWNASFGCG
jgi:hypothetical protein